MDFTKKLVLVLSALILTHAYAGQNEVAEEYVPNELIVKMKNSGFQTMGALASLQAEPIQTFRASGAMLVRMPMVVDAKKIMSHMLMSNNYEYVELNRIYHLNSRPNDPEFERLYGMNNEGKTGGSTDADIDAPEAWNVTVGSRDILVAVIDTGIDYTHPDLVDNVWTNPGESGLDENGNDKATNGIDDDQNGYVDDVHGWDFFNNDNDPMDGHSHGTHVSGTIGAVGNNGIGVAGVNWEVSIAGIKIFSDSGSTTTAAIVEGIEYATSIGVRVSNNSWGGGGESQPIRDAIAEANEKGIFFVAAAGNASNDNDRRAYYPANYELENIITVAATDHNDRLARFSNYGASTVDIAAPGVNIYSTTPNGRYSLMSGTSMAAPHVTGLVALVMSLYPEASLAEIRDRVVNTGDQVASLKGKVISNSRINAFNSLEDDDIPPNAPSNLQVLESGVRSVRLSFTPSGDDGFEGAAASYQIRISTDPITEENFEQMIPANFESSEKSEDRIVAKINGLPINFEGYVAIRAVDNIGNIGPVSESVIIRTQHVEVLFNNTGENLNGFTAVGPWGVLANDGDPVIADSPSGEYENNIDITLTSEVYANSGQYLALAFDHYFQFENNYDFGTVEIAFNGDSQWQEMAKFTGALDSKTSVFIDLTDRLQGVESFQIRFRLKSDRSAGYDGWFLDNIALMGSPVAMH